MVARFALLAQSEADVDGPSGDGSIVTEPYLGQTEPGRTPRAFARHITGRDLHTPPIFALDGASAYWRTMEGGDIQWMRFEDGAWQPPQALSSPHTLIRPFSVLMGIACTPTCGDRVARPFGFLGPEAGWGSPEELRFESTSPRSHWGFSMTRTERSALPPREKSTYRYRSLEGTLTLGRLVSHQLVRSR